MKAILFDAGPVEGCEPVTCTRTLGAVPLANRPLADLQRERLAKAGCELSETGGSRDLFVRHDAWLSDTMLQGLIKGGAPALRDDSGVMLAWIGDSAQAVLNARTLTPDKDSFLIRYPWDLLAIQEQVMAAIVTPRIEGEVSPAATIEGTLILGRGSRVLPGVMIEGTVVIGDGCKIGPNCYIRGATSIGNGCHIGQSVEIKNSIVMERTSIGHLSYCGDSIIGSQVNFGAGTITANFRHDGKNHRSMVGGKLLDTGRRKFGTIMGDGVHTGIHTSIYPGRKLWPGTSTLPGAIVKSDLHP
jgi:bifunctional UDP-N-acetylglucosamine pyrophosphorylase/glucosamine-1-phosphate N-acetyltransferase